MTEQERMKQGYIWEDDEENLALQAECKRLVKKFNDLPTEAMAEREAVVHEIFGEVGEHVWLNSPLTVSVGKYVSIGSGTYANMNLTLIDDWKITIGKNVLIGPNVTLCTTGHPIDPAHRQDGMYSFPITIGDNVWRYHRRKFRHRRRFCCDEGYSGKCGCFWISLQGLQGN